MDVDVATNRERMDVDVASNKNAHRSKEDEACTEIGGPVNLGTGESDVDEHSVTAILEGNIVPASTEDDDRTDTSSSDQEVTEVKRGKQQV